MATPAAEQLAHRLRTLRDQSKLTQGELAAIFSADGRQVGAAAISSWERVNNPAPVPESRLEPYARLPALRDGRLTGPDELAPEQRQAYDTLLRELTALSEEARGGSPAADAARAPTARSWFFSDGGPVTIITPDAPSDAKGPYGDESNPNYTALYESLDLDALIELHGHVRAENGLSFPVHFKPAASVESDDLSGHLVLIGGIAWNPVTRRLLRELDYLPVRQMAVPEVSTGEIFAVGHGAAERRFLPVFSQGNGAPAGELEEDVGLLARVPNPFNSSKTLTLCNGIHSRGVLGAVRTLTDARIREANEAYLAARFPRGRYGLLVRVRVFHGEALSPDLQNQDNILYAWPEGPTTETRRGAA
ncbi:hypothetical protein [Symbioplanes lichenis]|uniref:hypothetical protein n=1 Tax=Symbioplanes lichenis TaxID=1629072 RepID=UPI0027399414|nr:hypothetical protein [Actinoplanes lichenis]